MYRSYNTAGGGEGLRSIPKMSQEESSWQPSLRKMTKRMFSSSSKSPTQPAPPALPQGWIEENTVKSPNPNDTLHTTLPEHPQRLRERPAENFGFIKRATSRRDKGQLSVEQQTHGSNPLIAESSFSAASTQYTQLTRDVRYQDTGTETSPSSTLPRDLTTPTTNRTSYASKRSGNDYTNSSILLPTVYQPPASEVIDVSLDSFPAPPLALSSSNTALSPRISSPIIFSPPTRIMHIATEGKEGLQGLHRLSITEDPETLRLHSEPILEKEDAQKSSEQLNDDFQVFLAKSRTQANSRNSMLSFHNLKPDPQPQDISSTPRTAKVLDEITLARAKKRRSQDPSLSQTVTESKPRPLSTRVESEAGVVLQPQGQAETFPALVPESLVVSPKAPDTNTSTTQAQPGTPFHESRFSVDSRPHHNSMNSSLYGKVRGYIFPTPSRPTSTIPSALSVNNQPESDVLRLRKDQSYGQPASGTTRCGRWSRMGKSIKRSLSIDREKESEKRVMSGRKGVELLSDGDDMRDVGLEGAHIGRRGSKIMPTSRGLNCYNQTVNGGYWK